MKIVLFIKKMLIMIMIEVNVLMDIVNYLSVLKEKVILIMMILKNIHLSVMDVMMI